MKSSGFTDEAPTQWLLAVLVAAVLTAFPLASLLPEAFGVPSRPFSIAARAVVAGLAALVVLRWMLGRSRVYWGPALIAAAVVWVLLLVRMAYDFGNASVPYVLDPVDYVAIAVGACLLPMVALFERPSARTAVAAWWLTFGGAVLAAGGLGLLFARGTLVQLWQGRLASETLNPITVGYLGAVIVTLSVVAPPRVTAWARPAARHWTRALRAAGFAGGLALAVASGSRGPLLALLLSLSAFTLIAPFRADGRRRRLLLRAAASLALAACIAGATWWAIRTLDFNPFSRFVHVLEDSSTSYRAQALKGALGQFDSSPLFGDLLVERSTLDYPHNVVAESLMALGMPGFLALATVIGLSLCSVVSVLRSGGAACWIACVYLLQLTAATTSGSLYLSDGFWAFTAAVLACGARSRIAPVWRESAVGGAH